MKQKLLDYPNTFLTIVHEFSVQFPNNVPTIIANFPRKQYKRHNSH